jgi:hypothetical protein
MKDLISEYASRMSIILNRPCQMLFTGKPTAKVKSVGVTVREIKKGNIGDITNKPEKRQLGEKFYTPPCLLIRCDEGSLYLVVEDIESMLVSLGSLDVNMGTYTISFKWSD